NRGLSSSCPLISGSLPDACDWLQPRSSLPDSVFLPVARAPGAGVIAPCPRHIPTPPPQRRIRALLGRTSRSLSDSARVKIGQLPAPCRYSAAVSYPRRSRHTISGKYLIPYRRRTGAHWPDRVLGAATIAFALPQTGMPKVFRAPDQILCPHESGA